MFFECCSNKSASGSSVIPTVIPGWVSELSSYRRLATDHILIGRGEVFNLRWPDIDVKGRIVTIQGKGTKSGSTRHIPMNNEAFSLLVAWRNQSSDNELVFPSPATGKRFDNIASSWENLLCEAKVKDFHFHDLRHHFASKLVIAGIDLNTVRELLGHSSIEQTLRYAHLAPEQ